MEIRGYGKKDHVSVWIGKCNSMELFNAYIEKNYALVDEDDVSLFLLGNDFGIRTYDEDFSLVNYSEKPSKSLNILLDTGVPDYVVTHFIEQYGEELNEEYNCAVMFYDMEYTGEVKQHKSEKFGEFVFLGSIYSNKFDML